MQISMRRGGGGEVHAGEKPSRPSKARKLRNTVLVKKELEWANLGEIVLSTRPVSLNKSVIETDDDGP